MWSLEIAFGTNRKHTRVGKPGWRSREVSELRLSERHVKLMTLTVISSNEQRVKQPTYAVVQVPRLSMLPAGNDKVFHTCSSWAADIHTFDGTAPAVAVLLKAPRHVPRDHAQTSVGGMVQRTIIMR